MSEELQEVVDSSPEWYTNLQLEDAKEFIRSNMASASRSFIAIGYYLKYIKSNKLYEQDGYSSVWDFAQNEFNISRTWAGRWMAINDRFSKDGNSPVLLEQYTGFSASKLAEMLALTDEQLEQVAITTTVAQIRDIKQPEKDCAISHKIQEPEKVETVEADIIQTVPEDPEQYTYQDVKEELDKLTEYVESYRKDGGNFPGRRKAKMRLDAMPELPILRNNDQRKEFIEAYETWPIWIDLEQTGERYYRYDFENGDSFVIKVSRTDRKHYDWSTGKAVEVQGLRYEYQEEYILKPGKQFRDCANCISGMVDYLKDLQKKGA